jgi:hypothetical protein
MYKSTQVYRAIIKVLRDLGEKYGGIGSHANHKGRLGVSEKTAGESRQDFESGLGRGPNEIGMDLNEHEKAIWDFMKTNPHSSNEELIAFFKSKFGKRFAANRSIVRLKRFWVADDAAMNELGGQWAKKWDRRTYYEIVESVTKRCNYEYSQTCLKDCLVELRRAGYFHKASRVHGMIIRVIRKHGKLPRP